jgi:hypothetical protein
MAKRALWTLALEARSTPLLSVTDCSRRLGRLQWQQFHGIPELVLEGGFLLLGTENGGRNHLGPVPGAPLAGSKSI